MRKVVYWGVANPNPYTRFKRHGSYDAVSRTSPSELYSNSTVALNVETGKLVWYYQELPGERGLEVGPDRDRVVGRPASGVEAPTRRRQRHRHPAIVTPRERAPDGAT